MKTLKTVHIKTALKKLSFAEDVEHWSPHILLIGM